jgi:hypothetical protein
MTPMCSRSSQHHGMPHSGSMTMEEMVSSRGGALSKNSQEGS